MDMNLDTTTLVFFSPTHTTEKVVKAIGSGIGFPRREYVDLTLEVEGPERILTDRLTVIGVPVYAGRVAPLAVERLKRIKGNGCPAVLVAVYGNRDYEDALVELYDLAVEAGFRPFAAAAFVGEHSYSRKGMPIAEGRPDETDLNVAKDFGRKCLEKLQRPDCFEPFFIKGNRPYRTVGPSTPQAPVCNEKCFGCGECLTVCPTAAMSRDAEGKIVTDAEKCIKCCACVKACPNEARIFDTPYTAMLHTKFSTPRQPEMFL